MENALCLRNHCDFRFEDEVRKTVIVRAVLNINNVTNKELYGVGWASNCTSSSPNNCSQNKSKFFYQCAIVSEESGHSSETMYNIVAHSRLHPVSSVVPVVTTPPVRTPAHWQWQGKL